jgi:glycosyltransferase involved in cell wall biosynthesis
MVENVAVLIPAYQPDAALVRLVEELRGRFAHVVVVDDGSTSGAEALEAVRPHVDAVVSHGRNRGKGAALRTGFAWIRENLSDAKGVVTADADGQHRVDDICSVAAEVPSWQGGLVLGVRRFTGHVPLRSRFGNMWTRMFFWLVTGLAVCDTQTGLRGVPADLLGRMLEIGGDRYEYEMRMLVDARHHARRPKQIPIETVYMDGNKSSHFRPLRDSFLTQLALLRARFGM